MIKPPKLQPGDTIGIAAPASAFNSEAFSRGVERIRGAGYETFFRRDIFSREAYFAGADERRADEVQCLFSDKRVKAVFCARGGYGSQRLPPLLDDGVFRNNPGILMGHSDITALHCYLQEKCGLVTFHGPLVTELGSLDDDAFDFIFRSLSNDRPWGRLPVGRLDIIRPGRAEGIITGGNLTVFTSCLGTQCEADTAEKILFFEDRGEKPYAVDRLFTQLKLAGKFNSARGVILGRFMPPVGWDKGDEAYATEIRRIVVDILGEFGFPILANFPAGHFKGNITFPLGVNVALDGEKGEVTVTESCLT